jgi:CheY-like chemotaxis protein
MDNDLTVDVKHTINTVDINHIVKDETPLKDSKPNKEVTLKFIELIPKFLWLIFALIVFWLFYPEIKYDILPNITSFKIGGIEATLKQDFSSLAQNKPSENFNSYISPTQRDLIIQRSRTLYKRLSRSKILWVDPNLDNNKELRGILKKWDVSIDCAVSDKEAYQYLKNSFIDSTFYNLIITNNHHPEGSGIEFANKVRDDFYSIDIPIILFSASYGNSDTIQTYGIPKNIFAATNRYDYLFHFIFDTLERGNTPYPANIQRYSTNGNSLEVDK